MKLADSYIESARAVLPELRTISFYSYSTPTVIRQSSPLIVYPQSFRFGDAPVPYRTLLHQYETCK